MADIVISAEGLGKKYVIGHRSAERVPTLRDTITRTLQNFTRTTRDMLSGRPIIGGDEVEEFWALRDVNFEIKRGDVVGIIGRNGAGKSTLLKVLSRITEPSEGKVKIRGRVASLLEVGTGFHPELTGRENIFLNGAILGMTREEIRSRFDEIVAFAEVEKFLDTPVKRYSSGMYVRLAFAVAAHLEPEILVVDEVLAVGDAEFQKKCLGKMKDVAGDGRTVIFVSHNMASMRALCNSGIFLEHGQLVMTGCMEKAIERYAAPDRKNSPQSLLKGMRLASIDLRQESKRGRTFVDFSMQIQIERSAHIEHLALVIYGEGGVRVGVLDLRDSLQLPKYFPASKIEVTGMIPDIELVDREYEVGLFVGCDGESADFYSLHIFRPSPPTGQVRRYGSNHLGYVAMNACDINLQVNENYDVA